MLLRTLISLLKQQILAKKSFYNKKQQVNK